MQDRQVSERRARATDKIENASHLLELLPKCDILRAPRRVRRDRRRAGARGPADLFWTPRVAVAQVAPGALAAAVPGALLFASDGWIAAGYLFVWQIALFLALGESFSAFGGAMALAAVGGGTGGMMLGRLVDAGRTSC